MINLPAPCYICGEDAVLEGLCASCYAMEHPLIQVDTPLQIRTCKRCGAVKVPGGWKVITGPLPAKDELFVLQLVFSIHPSVKRNFSYFEILLEV